MQKLKTKLSVIHFLSDTHRKNRRIYIYIYIYIYIEKIIIKKAQLGPTFTKAYHQALKSTNTSLELYKCLKREPSSCSLSSNERQEKSFFL